MFFYCDYSRHFGLFLQRHKRFPAFFTGVYCLAW